MVDVTLAWAATRHPLLALVAVVAVDRDASRSLERSRREGTTPGPQERRCGSEELVARCRCFGVMMPPSLPWACAPEAETTAPTRPRLEVP